MTYPSPLPCFVSFNEDFLLCVWSHLGSFLGTSERTGGVFICGGALVVDQNDWGSLAMKYFVTVEFCIGQGFPHHSPFHHSLIDSWWGRLLISYGVPTFQGLLGGILNSSRGALIIF